MSIDIYQFCDNGDQLRSWMCKPFIIDDYIYATNGHLVVRIKSIILEMIPNFIQSAEYKSFVTNKVPDIFVDTLKRIFSKQYVATLPIAIDLEIMPEENPCNTCNSRGTITTDLHECPYCECEKYERDCHDCWGEGKINNIPISVIYGIKFNYHYIQKLKTLPNIKIIKPDNDQATYFSFDCGDGYIMPISTMYEIGKNII